MADAKTRASAFFMVFFTLFSSLMMFFGHALFLIVPTIKNTEKTDPLHSKDFYSSVINFFFFPIFHLGVSARRRPVRPARSVLTAPLATGGEAAASRGCFSVFDNLILLSLKVFVSFSASYSIVVNLSSVL
jgi:hypothetical protein